MHGHHYLFLSEDRGPDSRLGSTPRIESTVYVMGSDGQFVAVQTLPTDGAHARALLSWWTRLASRRELRWATASKTTLSA